MPSKSSSSGSRCLLRSVLTVAAATLASPEWVRGLEAPRPQDTPQIQGAQAQVAVEIRGEVVDHETREALKGAAVSLATGPRGTPGLGTRVTGQDGQFLFRRVPPGSYRLSVTAQGYRSMVDTLEVPPDVDLGLALPLSRGPARLEPRVTRKDRNRSGEEKRGERRSSRPDALVITREEIEERNAREITDLLRNVPGARIINTPGGGRTLLLRGGCEPTVWLDMTRIRQVGDLDALVPPNDVEFIEIYHGFDLPVEFGPDQCGGVLIRTRTGTPPPRGAEPGPENGFWRRLATISGFVLLVFLLSQSIQG